MKKKRKVCGPNTATVSYHYEGRVLLEKDSHNPDFFSIEFSFDGSTEPTQVHFNEYQIRQLAKGIAFLTKDSKQWI